MEFKLTRKFYLQCQLLESLTALELILAELNSQLNTNEKGFEACHRFHGIGRTWLIKCIKALIIRPKSITQTSNRD